MGCAKFSFDSLHLSPSHFFFLNFFCNIGKLVIYEAENGEGTENCLGFFKVWPISGSKCQERKKGPKKPGKTGGNFPAQPPTESAT